MAIKYIHQPTGDQVSKEIWRWRAVYKDGYVLDQFDFKDGQPVFHRYNEAVETTKDHGSIDLFSLNHDDKSPIVVKVPAGAEPIHFYRHRQVHELLNEGTENEQVTRQWRLKLWVIGFRIRNQYWLAYVNEQGDTVYSNDRELFIEDPTEK